MVDFGEACALVGKAGHVVDGPRELLDAGANLIATEVRLGDRHPLELRRPAIVNAPVTAVRAIAAEVRPRIQLDSLPDGLQAEWAAHE